MTHPLPTPRGALTPNRPLAELTWLRVGGPAEWLFQPADLDDLCAFLKALDPAVPVFPMGVGSNLIVRDGGLRAVVIRLGRGFNAVTVAGDTVTAGAAALDAQVARKAAEAGVDLAFLRTIPGSVGGAVRMNAGCYGSYVADVCTGVTAVTRAGEVVVLTPAELGFGYRHSALPEGWVIVGATFAAPRGDPQALEAKMAEQIARRDASQPTKDRSAGSTFRNPAGMKAWELIDAAGCRGLTRGGAQVSEKHCNFLLNTGDATAADIEGLGDDVRRRVRAASGVSLEWEIRRIGRAAGKPEAAA